MYKLNLPPVLTLLLFGLLVLNSCKKDTSTTANNGTSAADSNTFSAAIDGLSSDASAAAGQVSGFAGKTANWAPVLACLNAVADSGNGQTITISYNGAASCDGLYRSGTVTVTLAGGTLWSNAGSQLNVTITNMKITTLLGSSYTLNGTYTITNETGGLAWEIVAGVTQNATARHKVTSSNVSITFSDGTQRTWNVNRSTSYTSVVSGSKNTITVSIFSENPTNAGQDTWGTNRYGQSFTTTIADTISSNNNLNCEYRPFTGQYVYHLGSVYATITFGTNSAGASEGSPTTCAPGFYLTYTNGTANEAEFIAYW